MKSLIIWYIVIIAFLVSGESQESNQEKDATKLLRAFYYQAAADEAIIPEGLKLVENLKIIYPQNSGLFEIYEGAFYTLKAKHAFWPYEKLSYANKGLQIMDTGLAKAPENIEGLFIHGTICDNLPFFMGRSEDATADFRKIVTLLTKNPGAIDKALMDDIFNYLQENREEKIPQSQAIVTLSMRKVIGTR